MNLMCLCLVTFFTLAFGSLYCHAEFSSASVRGEGLVMTRGEILKQVQDDVVLGVLMTLERSVSMFYFNL